MDIKEQIEQPAQKKTQTQQIVEQLEKGVSEVFESEQYKQLGNSVCIPMISAVSLQIKKQFFKDKQ